MVTLGFALLQRRILAVDASEPNVGSSFRFESVLRAYRPLLWHWPTLGVVGATLLGQVGFWATLTYLSAFLVHIYGLSISEAGAVYGAGGLGLLLGNVAASGPLGRLPLRTVLATNRLIQVPLLFGILVLNVPVLAIVILLLVVGLLQGAATALGMTLVSMDSPAGRATTVTLNQPALTLGVALAGAVGGLVLAFASYQVLGMGLTLAGCVAALLLWWTRPRGLLSQNLTCPADHPQAMVNDPASGTILRSHAPTQA
jgi:predicted MFS family arabinose efflux permease